MMPPFRLTHLYPTSASLPAALAERRPLRQYMAIFLSVGRAAFAFSTKSLCPWSIRIAPWICPSANSAAVRTSSTTTLVSAISSANPCTSAFSKFCWPQAVFSPRTANKQVNNFFINNTLFQLIVNILQIPSRYSRNTITATLSVSPSISARICSVTKLYFSILSIILCSYNLNLPHSHFL